MRRSIARRNLSQRHGWLASAFLAATAATAVRAAETSEEFFEARIRPILAEHCLECHSADQAKSHLRLISRDELLKGGSRGAAIVPREPESSLLIQAVRRTHPKVRMPPDAPLPEQAVRDLEQWVASGAAWPASLHDTPSTTPSSHWVFEPITSPAVPEDTSGWSDQPIDRFIAARHREHGLSRVAPAEKAVLLRRASFDLIGLPPTPDELADFAADASHDALASVVDRLLASPRFGERWGRHWMDVVRYADTAGDNADYPIPEAAKYRDYIIDAFNADLPYDEFVREQIAGDILAREQPSERYQERIIATTFLALSRRYATAPYELWHLTLEDTLDTIGKAFLGLTLRCARCHDHKYDPITSEDYYALYGIFASTQFPFAGSEEFASKKFPRQHFVPLIPADELAPRMAEHQRRLETLTAEIEALEKKSGEAQRLSELDGRIAEAGKAVEVAGDDAARGAATTVLDQLKDERERVQRELNKQLRPLRDELATRTRLGVPPEVPLAYAVSEGAAADAAIQRRGDPGDLGPIAHRGAPKFLAGNQPWTIPHGASGRRQLAEWLASPDNPLTARVIVNRLWQHLFGRGLVGTPSNFGVRGEGPTHPDLLDYLASQLVREGWSIKHMVREMVLSKTYQLGSAADARGLAVDPDNRLYWRHERRRLDAEAIRDSMLAVAGNLDESRPAGHPFPGIAKWGWTQHNAFKEVYPSNHRSVYLMTQRLQRHPFLALFDGADPNTSTDVRGDSTVPLQAMFLMNNPWVSEKAASVAGRIASSNADMAQRVARAHELLWGRIASDGDIARGCDYLRSYQEELARAGTDAGSRALDAWTSLARVMFSASEFFYID